MRARVFFSSSMQLKGLFFARNFKKLFKNRGRVFHLIKEMKYSLED